MDTKNCVISAVGRNSLHRKWLEGEPRFDLHLIVYDDSMEKFRGDTAYVCHLKGYKLKVVYQYLSAHPELQGWYDYFFLPDDDILMDAATVNALFEAMRHYRLKIAQPALAMSYYSWPHTLRDKHCKLRYTNFVEMMVPCFSREALGKVLFTFNENETGWGTEAHWPLLVGAGLKDMAIIDEVGVVHTRPIQSGKPQHWQEQAAYLQKYNLTIRVQEYGTIPAEGEHLFFCSRMRQKQLAAMLVHWIEGERIATSSVGEDGYFGYAHFLFLLARITEAQKYADMAGKVLNRAQDWLGMVKNDMSFRHGIKGGCWLVEHLARKGFIEDDPQEVLDEIDQYIGQYLKAHQDILSFTELAGIGRYYLEKWKNRPMAEYMEDCKAVTGLLRKEMANEKVAADTEAMADALELLQACGLEDKEQVRKLEKHVGNNPCTPVEHVHGLFRMYGLTQEEYFRIGVREELENLPPLILSLNDALELAEILSSETN